MTETIEIPAKRGLFRRGAPPIEIELPFEARSSKAKNVALFLFGAPLGFGVTLLAAFMVSGAVMGSPHTPATARGWLELIKALSLGVSALTFGIGLSGAGITCLLDALRRGPALVVSAAGLVDRRQRATLAWSDVRRATLNSRATAVILELARPIDRRHNPFRIGLLGQVRRRRPLRLDVPITSLDASAHVVGQLINALATKHGAGAEAVDRS